MVALIYMHGIFPVFWLTFLSQNATQSFAILEIWSHDTIRFSLVAPRRRWTRTRAERSKLLMRYACDILQTYCCINFYYNRRLLMVFYFSFFFLPCFTNFYTFWNPVWILRDVMYSNASPRKWLSAWHDSILGLTLPFIVPVTFLMMLTQFQFNRSMEILFALFLFSSLQRRQSNKSCKLV